MTPEIAYVVYFIVLPAFWFIGLAGSMIDDWRRRRRIRRIIGS